MPHEVLIALGPYEACFKALRFATDLYQHVDDAHLEVTHIVTEGTEDTSDQLISDAETIIEDSGYAGEYEINLIEKDGSTYSNSQAGEIITRHIEEHGYDHILMGQPDRSLWNHLLHGSATDKVLEGTPHPVTLVGTDFEKPKLHVDVDD